MRTFEREEPSPFGRVVTKCAACGCEIVEGEEFFRIEDEDICTCCIEDWTEEHRTSLSWGEDDRVYYD